MSARAIWRERTCAAAHARGVSVAGLMLLLAACGGSQSAPAPPVAPAPAAVPKSGTPAAVGEAPAGAVDTRDETNPAFQTDFASREPGYPWNVFGAREGNRQVWGGPEGLWVKIASAEKAWDAVGIRTNRIEVEGDFDLRAGFRDFSAPGNASAKLLVVDARGPRGEAAYVERIRVDGKSLLKWGGEVEGSLENWGFVTSDLSAGELRLVRKGKFLHGYARPDNSEMWAEIGPPQAVPRSMPDLVKFGVRLSAEARKSAQVRFVWLTLRGSVKRRD